MFSLCGCLSTEYNMFLTTHNAEHHSLIFEPTSLPQQFQEEFFFYLWLQGQTEVHIQFS